MKSHLGYFVRKFRRTGRTQAEKETFCALTRARDFAQFSLKFAGNAIVKKQIDRIFRQHFYIL